MRTKNLTPFLFGAKVTSLDPPALQMTMIVRAAFTLRPGEPPAPIDGLVAQGRMTGDEFEEDDDDRAGACRYASDYADFKLNAEVLLRGACHAPGRRPVSECPVRFSVGAWSKALRVVGKRVWTQGMVGPGASDPEPFVTMPIGYASAFGGPSHPQNPVGKGRDTPELPNVEDPAAPVRGKGDRPAPAGFGPINPAWPQRAAKMGTEYGARWRKERAPFFSEDFDWTYFHAAPADQQLPGYLHGDEEISFLNLHPDAPVFSARLPGLRVRAFARDVEGTLREARMNLDTLFADLDEGRLILTWRGLVPVKEDDLADVKTVLVASEGLADPLLPLDHYGAILEKFEADPLEFEEHAPGARRALAALDEAMKDDAAHPERTPQERAEALGKHQDAIVALAPEGQQAEMRRAFAAAQAKLAATPAPPAPAEGTPPTGAMVAGAVARVTEAVESLRREGHPSAELDQLDRLLSDPKTKKHLAALVPPAPEEIGPGKDLSGRTLADLDLEGRDLSGANLEGANLKGARLAGARLRGANLRMALMGGAHLEGADLSDADLTQALLTQAHAEGADLRRATIDLTVLDSADLRGANLSGTRGKMTVLSGADLTGADLRGCDLDKVSADGARIAGADLREAKLYLCSFSGAKAEGVKLAGAVLTHTSFSGAEMQRADCKEVQGEASNWSGALLEEADFRSAVLPRSHFSEARAAGATWSGADLRDADLYRACLDRADFTEANLFGANLGKTTLNGTRFVNANLYASRFIGAGGKDCDLHGANVKRAIMPS